MSLVINEEAAPLSDINPTPLIDVLLVLLIVLILALPLATHKTGIELPILDGGTAAQSVTVEIDFDGSIYWNGEYVEDLAMLERYFVAAANEIKQPNVLLNANRNVKYDNVAKVLAIAQRNGIKRLGFSGQERFIE